MCFSINKIFFNVGEFAGAEKNLSEIHLKIREKNLWIRIKD